MNFKVWLEDEETYERKYKTRATRASLGENYPFAQWFPAGQERLLLPFFEPPFSAASQYLRSSDFLAPEDQEIIQGLKDLGHEVVDYKQGYVRRGKGVEKIGGLLEKLKKTDEPNKEKYTRWQQHFMSSPARNNKNLADLHIIISRNPHDIAQMSYDRSWESCMDLEDGQYKNTPFCVIKTGGMVAYLVRGTPDLNAPYIKHPLARLAIKVARNKGHYVAVPENTVYPHNIRGFYETVVAWLEGRQAGSVAGRYQVKGGYSDTFGSDPYKAYHHAPSDEASLKQWLESPLEVRQQAAIKKILDSQQTYSPEIYQTIKDYLMKKQMIRHSQRYFVDQNEQLLFMVKRFPELFTDADYHHFSYFIKKKANLLNHHDLRFDDFYEKYSRPLDNKDGIVKIKKPSDHEVSQVKQSLEDIEKGKAKLADSESLAHLINYIMNLHSYIRLHHTDRLMLQHTRELYQQMATIANSVFSMVRNANVEEISKYKHAWGIYYDVARLAELALDWLPLNKEMVTNLWHVLEKMNQGGFKHTLHNSKAIIAKIIHSYDHASTNDTFQVLQNLERWLKLKTESYDVGNPVSIKQDGKMDWAKIRQYSLDGILSAEDVRHLKSLIKQGWSFQDALTSLTTKTF
jgi:hypothetical protein